MTQFFLQLHYDSVQELEMQYSAEIWFFGALYLPSHIIVSEINATLVCHAPTTTGLFDFYFFFHICKKYCASKSTL